MQIPSLGTPRAWRWARRTLVGLAAGGLILLLAGEPVVGATIFGAMFLGLLLLESAQLRAAVLEGQRQQYALTQIRPLFGDLPVELGGWAADAVLLQNAMRLIVENRPRLVLECGSGSSTIVIARCLRALGGRIISLEHDPAYARRTEELVRLYGLDDLVTVVTALLVPRDVNGETAPWYASAYEPFLKEPIDVLLVDGPQKAVGWRARYPAVPLLKSRLAPECWILMDDGDRPDEQAIAHAWSKDLGAKLTYLEGGRGGWLLHREAPEPAARPAI
jgi:predicted O-methyltransferase YrrM